MSVSRHHSTFEILEVINSKGKEEILLTVSDEMSKFGTLVFMRKPVPIKKGKKIHVQVGRSIFTLSTQDRLNAFQKCFCLKSALKKDESNAIVHFNEAKKYFPSDLQTMFGYA